jgi:hypothetical protein
MSLNPCAVCGAEAHEHIRGKHLDEKVHEVHDDNRNDFRVACSKCDNATGWNKPDAPGMPGVGADFSRKLWNDRNPVK